MSASTDAIEVEIPERYKLTKARNAYLIGSNAYSNDARWIAVDVVNWIQERRGLVGSACMSDYYFASFLDSDTAMLFKLTFPP